MGEDRNGKAWLMMLNLDTIINSALLPPSMAVSTTEVNQRMRDITLTGASGMF